MRCPECRSYGYRRKTMTPEWCCSKCGQEWGRNPEPSCSSSSRSSFDPSPTTWNLVADASLICGHRVCGQGGNADAWTAPGGIGKRFWHVYSWVGTAGRGHLRHLWNNRAVGWTYFRYVRQKAGVADWPFAYDPGSFGVRSGVELRFLNGHTAHHRSRISHASPDHHGGVGRQLTA